MADFPISSGLEEAKGEKYIFANLKIRILPTGIGGMRLKLLNNQVMKFGGEITEDLKSVTHLIVEDSVDYSKLEKIAQDHLQSMKVVKSIWLSKCLEEKRLINTSPFEVKLSKSPKRQNEEISSETGDTGSKKQKYCSHDHDESNSGLGSENISPHTSQEKNKPGMSKWVCSYSSADQPTNHNCHITEKLEILAETYKNTKDHWRALVYQKAIIALRQHPKQIATYQEALSIPGIGDSLANKIWEIIESGHLRKIDEICSEGKVEAINLFTKIWGAGPATAELWVQQGFHTLEDLKLKAQLSYQQKIGLKHFDDFLDRMPREEAKEIAEVVESNVLSINPGLKVVACGSYRRGKKTCGDVDMLVTHPDKKSHKGILSKIVDKLHEIGFLTDDLVKHGEYGSHTKYLGVCKLSGDNQKRRRLDIITVPYDELACAMLYFTGSAHFNRSMRLLARKKGMALSEHSLNSGVVRKGQEKINKGYILPTPTEQSVFEHLGLDYRTPEERDH